MLVQDGRCRQLAGEDRRGNGTRPRGGRREGRARRADRIDALATELGGVARATDVTQRGDLAALVELAGARFGKLDVLVGNAGIARVGPLDDLAVDDWLAMVDVNLNGFAIDQPEDVDVGDIVVRPTAQS